MNKRIEKKVSKRENGGVLPANFARAAAKAPTPKRGAKKTKARAASGATGSGATGTVERARAAVGQAVDEAKQRVEHAVDDAKQRVESVVDEAKAKVASKVADLKGKLHDKEQQAEEALSKIPLVGKAAAAKLHDLTK